MDRVLNGGRDGSPTTLVLWDCTRCWNQTYVHLWCPQARCTPPVEVGRAEPQPLAVTVKVDSLLDPI